MTEEGSAWASLLRMTDEDVKALEAQGLGPEDVNYYIHDQTLEQVGRFAKDDDSVWRRTKRWLVEIPGGVAILKKAKEV